MPATTTITVPWTRIPVTDLQRVVDSVPDSAHGSTLQADALVIYATMLLHASNDGETPVEALDAWACLWGISPERRDRAVQHLLQFGIITWRGERYFLPATIVGRNTSRGAIPDTEQRFVLLTLPSLAAALLAKPGRSATRQAATYLAVMSHRTSQRNSVVERGELAPFVGVTTRRLGDALRLLENAEVVQRTARYRAVRADSGKKTTERAANCYEPLVVATISQAKRHGLAWACTRDFKAIALQSTQPAA